MTDTPPRTAKDPTGRQARLRDALRDNLKRRKLQARGRAGQSAPPDGDHSRNVQDSPSGAADVLVEGSAPNVEGERR
ncbi:hypothetical protein [Rhodopseudomonas telluris]|uniref:Uncharacterized protein n=1 Tax=Rhodopseudomonas telluris TaxID=644215 RepID=A0ABV6EVG7_9BRAD